jgi:ERCC4-related helicase
MFEECKVEMLETFGSDLTVVNAARVSLGKHVDEFTERDAKLLELKKIVQNKLSNPINPNNKKIIVFTAFADTAKYIHGEMTHWLKKEHGLFSALVTGSDTNKTNMPNCKSDLSSILTNFSPRSKKSSELNPNEEN